MASQLKIQTGQLLFNNEQFQVIHAKKKWYDGQLFTIVCGFIISGSLIKTADDDNDRTKQVLGIALLAGYLILFGFFLWDVLVKRRKPVTDTLLVKDIRKIKIKPTLFGNRVVKIYHQKDDVYRLTAHRVDLDEINFTGVVSGMGITVE